MPIVEAMEESLQGYGHLVDSPDFPIEIVRWPAPDWRPVDPDSGDEGGVTEGVFLSEWKGDVLFGSNEAVGGHYILAYAVEPAQAWQDHNRAPERMLLWHANYHPDGGQLFFPLDNQPFFVPLALPGTTFARSISSVSVLTARRATTSIPTSGTKASSP
jgi:hypothetical protein